MTVCTPSVSAIQESGEWSVPDINNATLPYSCLDGKYDERVPDIIWVFDISIEKGADPHRKVQFQFKDNKGGVRHWSCSWKNYSENAMPGDIRRELRTQTTVDYNRDTVHAII